MADAPPGRTWKHYLAMGIGGAVGWGMSNKLIRLGQRISNAVSKWGIVESKHETFVGSGVAILVYLSIMAFGWHKTGIMGDFFVGWAGGALLDELLALGG